MKVLLVQSGNVSGGEKAFLAALETRMRKYGANVEYALAEEVRQRLDADTAQAVVYSPYVDHSDAIMIQTQCPETRVITVSHGDKGIPIRFDLRTGMSPDDIAVIATMPDDEE